MRVAMWAFVIRALVCAHTPIHIEDGDGQINSRKCVHGSCHFFVLDESNDIRRARLLHRCRHYINYLAQCGSAYNRSAIDTKINFLLRRMSQTLRGMIYINILTICNSFFLYNIYIYTVDTP